VIAPSGAWASVPTKTGYREPRRAPFEPERQERSEGDREGHEDRQSRDHAVPELDV